MDIAISGCRNVRTFKGRFKNCETIGISHVVHILDGKIGLLLKEIANNYNVAKGNRINGARDCANCVNTRREDVDNHSRDINFRILTKAQMD